MGRLLLEPDGLLAVLARLGEREGAAPPSLAAEAAVGAVAEAGRRTGRVGDLGRGLLRGDVGPAFLLGPAFDLVGFCFAGSTVAALAAATLLTLSALVVSVGPSVCGVFNVEDIRDGFFVSVEDVAGFGDALVDLPSSFGSPLILAAFLGAFEGVVFSTGISSFCTSSFCMLFFLDSEAPLGVSVAAPKGEPFRTEPRSGTLVSGSEPPVTAVSSFGSAGDIPAGSSSAPVTGLSGFAAGTLSEGLLFSELLEARFSTSLGISALFWVTDSSEFPFVEGLVVFPFSFGPSALEPPVAALV